MRKSIFALVLVLAMAINGMAAVSMNEMLNSEDQELISSMKCSEKTISSVLVTYKDKSYLVLVEATTAKMIIVTFSSAGQPELFVVGTAAIVDKRIKFTEVETLPAAKGVEKYPSPCIYIEQKLTNA